MNSSLNGRLKSQHTPLVDEICPFRKRPDVLQSQGIREEKTKRAGGARLLQLVSSVTDDRNQL